MSLLIRNARVLGAPKGFSKRSNGNGIPSSDVFITGDSISAIGDFPQKSADNVIDAEGAYLTSGFVDPDNASDHFLDILGDAKNSIADGVTTAIGGHCGASLAPLLYGDLSTLRKWADLRAANVSWHTLSQFMSMLDRRGCDINFGTFAGHSTIRRALTGEAIRDLTKKEIEVFCGILERALAEGAFGLSTGLEYAHTRGTPYSELKILLARVGKARGIHSIHLRHTGKGMLDSVKEAIKLQRETKVRTLITHLEPRRGAEAEYRQALELLLSLSPEETRFTVSPHSFRVVPLYQLLPEWARNGNLELMVKNVHDDWMAKRIQKDLEELGPEDLRVSCAPGNPAFTGKTLGDIMKDVETGDPREALLALMRGVRLRAVMEVRDIRSDLLREALGHPLALIGSHGRQGTFQETLKRAGEHHLPLAEAVSRLTAEPARFFDLRRRGEVKEGFLADLVIFKDALLKHVILNGKVVLLNTVPTGSRAGKPLIAKKPES